MSAPAAAAAVQPSATQRARGLGGVLLFAVPLFIIAILCFGADALPLPSPTAQDLENSLVPPVWMEGGSPAHLLGTDHLGRDLLARILHGGKVTFLVAVSAMLSSAILGTLVGLVSGFYRGWTDRIVSRLVEAQLALPFILLAIGIISARGRSIGVLIAMLALIG